MKSLKKKRLLPERTFNLLLPEKEDDVRHVGSLAKEQIQQSLRISRANLSQRGLM